MKKGLLTDFSITVKFSSFKYIICIYVLRCGYLKETEESWLHDSDKEFVALLNGSIHTANPVSKK